MAPFELCFKGVWRKVQNDEFYVKISKNVKNVLKIFSTTHNSGNFAEFSQNHIFDRSDFTTAVRKSLSRFAPFSPGSILVPKMHFWAQKAFWASKYVFGPKMHFGLLFAPWPQMLMKPMVSASDFPLWDVTMRK